MICKIFKRFSDIIIYFIKIKQFIKFFYKENVENALITLQKIMTIMVHRLVKTECSKQARKSSK